MRTFILAVVLTLAAAAVTAEKTATVVSIDGERFKINGALTYAGCKWNGLPIEGLLFNARTVQATFDDLSPETRERWKYPDTGVWSPDRNTTEFCAAMGEWRRHGLLAVTVNLQGGMPVFRTETKQPWLTSAFTESGDLRKEYSERLDRVLRRADELGMVVIVGLFYFGQDQFLHDEAAVKHAIEQSVDWLLQRGYQNVLLEINNECDILYDHAILRPEHVAELIRWVKNRTLNERRLLVSTSFSGGKVPNDDVIGEADFILFHGNGCKPEKITSIVERIRASPKYRAKPIVVNEDDQLNCAQDDCNLVRAVKAYASWGYYDQGKNNYSDGFQSPPVNWSISTPVKTAFFNRIAELTGSPRVDEAKSGEAPAKKQ